MQIAQHIHLLNVVPFPCEAPLHIFRSPRWQEVPRDAAPCVVAARDYRSFSTEVTDWWWWGAAGTAGSKGGGGRGCAHTEQHLHTRKHIMGVEKCIFWPDLGPCASLDLSGAPSRTRAKGALRPTTPWKGGHLCVKEAHHFSCRGALL